MTVGDRIAEMRKKKGLSQRALAKSCGVSQPTISAIESSTKAPSTVTVSLVASALGCTVAELMGETVETRKPTDDEIKFALFGGDQEITDEQFEEVKRYALYLKERGRNDGRSPHHRTVGHPSQALMQERAAAAF